MAGFIYLELQPSQKETWFIPNSWVTVGSISMREIATLATVSGDIEEDAESLGGKQRAS